MRLFSARRIGQSGLELVAAILLSFVFHGLLVLAILFLRLVARSTISVPLSYQVMLVNPQPEAALTPVERTQSAMAAPIVKKFPVPKAKHAPKPKLPALSKSKMPEISASKNAPKKTEPERPSDPVAPEKPATAAPAAPAEGAEKAASVVVAQPQDVNLPGYLPLVREKIERNWNPPPGARGIKVKVVFTIQRTGILTDVRLLDSSGNFYFDQAAIRSIRSSNPFPPLPEQFSRESLELSVDLAEKE